MRIMLDFLFNRYIFIYLYNPIYLLKVYWANYSVTHIVKKHTDCFYIKKNNLVETKSNSKVFIIGTGTSINQLNSDDWDYISNFDTIGLNFSFLHQYVPTIQLVQLPTKSIIDMDRMIKGLNKKMLQHPSIITILRSSRDLIDHANYGKFQELNNFFIPKYEVFIPYRNQKLFRTYLKIVNKVFDPLLIQTRGGALTSAIFLAIKLGYKEIELVGINDGDSNYFYHESKDYVDENYLNFVPDSKQKTIIHGHFFNLADDKHLSTDDVIFSLINNITNSSKVSVNYFKKTSRFNS
jgi:hypothetical protein